MIRVLHVIDSFDLGGAQTVILNYLRHRDRSRFHVEVATMHGRGVFWEPLAATGVTLHSLAQEKWPPAYIPNLWRLLRRGRFDIVQFHLFGANWIGKPLAALGGIRRIIAHDHCNDEARSGRAAAVLLDAILNRLAWKILAVSRSTLSFLEKREGLVSGRLVYFPNPVDTAIFRSAAPEEKSAARAKFGIPPGAVVVGGAGRLNQQKNFALWIEAASRVKGVPVYWIIAGDGPERRGLTEPAARAGVRLAGFIDDMPSYYAALDIFFVSSDFEGMAMNILEAMGSGLPVVATDVDGNCELVFPGENGFLYPRRDPAAAAQHLARLASDPDLRRRLGEQGRRRAVEEFGAAEFARRLENLYAEALPPGLS